MDANIEKPTILVLGGSGLLGCHCQANLVNDFRVVTTYNTHQTNYGDSIPFNVLDSGFSLESILRKYRPKAIINAIALVTVEGCEANPQLAHLLNVKFVQDLVEAMKKVGMHDSHLVQISSDSVYGKSLNTQKIPWSEEDTVNPLSFYAKTKLDGEKQAQHHVGPVSILRTAFYGISPFSEKNLLDWIIGNARQGKTMNGWENVYFSPVSANSLVRVIRLMIDKNFSGVLNVGSVDACNKYDFVEAVCAELGLTATVNRITSSAQGGGVIRPEYSVLSHRKLAGLLSWNVHWRDDLREYLTRMFL